MSELAATTGKSRNHYADRYGWLRRSNVSRILHGILHSDIAFTVNEKTHTCEFGEWVDDVVTDTHTRTCLDPECGKTETKPHDWGDGVQNGTPTCTEGATVTYTCAGCGKVKTENVDPLNHDWSEWTDDGEDASTDTHSRTCMRDGCGATESESHAWSKWVSVDADTHQKVCSVCKGTRTAAHHFDGGVVTKEATHLETGVMTFTCTDGCGYYYTEEIPKATEHAWSDWMSNNNNGTHNRYCSCGETETRDCTYDEGVVTKEATHYEEGEKLFTCHDCDGTKTETIAKTAEHEWSDWMSNNNNGTHSRYCGCGETETRDCTYDEGVVTKEATHYEEGEKLFTCHDCDGTKTETIVKTTEHEWSDWMSNNNNGTHSRYCRCGETETKDCEWDDGVVDVPPTHTEPGTMRFTCTDCKATRTEEIPKTAEHRFSDWRVFENDPGKHYRECACGEHEIAPHNWGAWVEQTAGAYTRTCEDCGVSETMTLDEEKPVNTTSNDNAANTNLTNTDIELIDKILTDQEQSQVAGGSEVIIYLKVEDITSDTPTEHKEEAEAKAGNAEIGMYLDIELFKQIDTATEVQVTETNGTVCITITIPDNLINTDPSVTRTYKIIRVHEDENGNLITDVIEGIFNPEDNTYVFETDKFSTYALAYEDLDSPQTGDNRMMGLWIALLFVSGFGVVATAVYGKKRKSVK